METSNYDLVTEIAFNHRRFYRLDKYPRSTSILSALSRNELEEGFFSKLLKLTPQEREKFKEYTSPTRQGTTEI